MRPFNPGSGGPAKPELSAEPIIIRGRHWRSLSSGTSHLSEYMSSPLEDSDPVPDASENPSRASLTQNLRSLLATRSSDSRLSRGSLGVSRTGAEQEFRQKCVDDLRGTRTPKQRVDAIHRIHTQLVGHLPETIIDIWDTAADLAGNGAVPESRSAAYTLLVACVSHGGLESHEYHRFFAVATEPLHPSSCADQVKALKALTDDGRNLVGFQTDVVQFLYKGLKTQFGATLSARKHQRDQFPRRSRENPVEKGLWALLSLLADVVTKNPGRVEGDDLFLLVGNAAYVASRTTAKADARGAVAVFKAVISTSRIPSEQLKQCVKILCGLCGSDDNLGDVSWSSLVQLLQSQDQAGALAILLDILFEGPQDAQSRTVRGAVLMIKYLIPRNGKENHPVVSPLPVIKGLWEVYFVSTKLQRDCLEIIGLLLNDEGCVNRLLQEDWTTMTNILSAAAGDKSFDQRKENPQVLRVREFSSSPYVETTSIKEDDPKLQEDTLYELKNIASIFKTLWPRLSWKNKQCATSFELFMHKHYPTHSLELFIKFLCSEGLLLPPHADWQTMVARLVDCFLLDRSQHLTKRSLVLPFVEETLAHVQSEEDKQHFDDIVSSLTKGLAEEHTLPIINAFAKFATSYLLDVDSAAFGEILRIMTLIAVRKAASEDITNVSGSCLVQIFLRYLTKSSIKAEMVFRVLLALASNRDSSEACLCAMKLLTRLRCDSSSSILVIPLPDGLNLAATLCRTETSAYRYTELERVSVPEEQPSTRSGRPSSVLASRPSTRSASAANGPSKPRRPLWMYPGGKGLPEDPPSQPSHFVRANTPRAVGNHTLELGRWLEIVIAVIQNHQMDWEIYSYALVHLPSQLSNPAIFQGAVPQIQLLRSIVVQQLQSKAIRVAPPNTGVKQGDIALCLFYVLVMLLGYKEHFGRSEQDDIVKTLLAGIGEWDRVAKFCVHGLTICCHEIPRSIARSLTVILTKMSQIIPQSYLATDVLEFLGGLARLPDVYINLTEGELRTVFAICTGYLGSSREQRLRLHSGANAGGDYASNRHSNSSAEFGSVSDSSHSIDIHRDLPQYVFALAYHVMACWFLSLKLADRSKHVGWITKNLAWKDKFGTELMEEQSQVFLDMMHRTAYSDLGETVPSTVFQRSDGQVLRKSWLIGLSIQTIETAAGTGLTQLTKRQASGTTHALYQQHTTPLPSHHVPAPTDVLSSLHGPSSRINIFPNHVFLQLQSTIAPTPSPMEPICLPDDEATKRAIASFDRMDTVDGHKVGVIYIGNAQTSEPEILANTAGSGAFDKFLASLGTKVRLQGAPFNTQGLDRETDLDGEHTYAWRDRITEIIFHVTTMMPTKLEDDPRCNNKKRHIGNDFVNIIFNESGLPFHFETFPSQFNYVFIVVSPEHLIVPAQPRSSTLTSDDNDDDNNLPSSSEQNPDALSYFRVQTVCHRDFPQLFPTATPKIVSADALPGLVRQIALYGSVFSLSYLNREGGEHVSNWRSRLREILKLRERFANTGKSTSEQFPGALVDKKYVEGNRWAGTVAMGGLAEEEGVLMGLDFSRWAGLGPTPKIE
ncbi:Tuberous sclerosis 2-like protein [Loxospora ochrophaea]|nr:Tuberous sclerosis 2-like protein [Loxospora ochrophaea]